MIGLKILLIFLVTKTDVILSKSGMSYLIQIPIRRNYHFNRARIPFSDLNYRPAPRKTRHLPLEAMKYDSGLDLLEYMNPNLEPSSTPSSEDADQMFRSSFMSEPSWPGSIEAKLPPLYANSDEERSGEAEWKIKFLIDTSKVEYDLRRIRKEILLLMNVPGQMKPSIYYQKNYEAGQFILIAANAVKFMFEATPDMKYPDVALKSTFDESMRNYSQRFQDKSVRAFDFVTLVLANDQPILYLIEQITNTRNALKQLQLYLKFMAENKDNMQKMLKRHANISLTLAYYKRFMEPNLWRDIERQGAGRYVLLNHKKVEYLIQSIYLLIKETFE